MYITFQNGTPVLMNASQGVILMKLIRVSFRTDPVTKQLIPGSGTADIRVRLPGHQQTMKVTGVPLR